MSRVLSLALALCGLLTPQFAFGAFDPQTYQWGAKDPRYWMDQSSFHLGLSRYADAAHDLDVALENWGLYSGDDPDQTRAEMVRQSARLHSMAGDALTGDEAAAEYQLALGRINQCFEDQNPEDYVFRGSLLFSLGMFEPALADFDEPLRLNMLAGEPVRRREVWGLKAAACRALGDSATAAECEMRARPDYEEPAASGSAPAYVPPAVISKHDVAGAESVAAYGYDARNSGNYERAADFFRQALELDSSTAYWDEAGYAYYKLGQYERADSCYAAGHKKTNPALFEPTMPSFYSCRAENAWLAGNTDYAIAAQRRAVALAPTEQSYVTTLAAFFDRAGEPDSAKFYQGRAAAMTRVNPPSPATKPAASGRNAQGFREFVWRKDNSVMITIPAGEFLMGSPDNEGMSWEHPQHKVYVEAFSIDKYEVTNEQYAKFCAATGRLQRDVTEFDDMPAYTSSGPSSPAVKVTWLDAAAYAKWAGKRLPTEAEWEKAARGSDGRLYPWGNEAPDADGIFRANLGPRQDTVAGKRDGYLYCAPVGSFPAGASPYGVMDMAGNVDEWCVDRFEEDYYAKGPARNPKGPASGLGRVCRGGNWGVGAEYLRCAARTATDPSWPFASVGFRCVANAK